MGRVPHPQGHPASGACPPHTRETLEKPSTTEQDLPTRVGRRPAFGPPQAPTQGPHQRVTTRAFFLHFAHHHAAHVQLGMLLSRPASVLADVTTILIAAPAMSFKLTMGMSPF